MSEWAGAMADYGGVMSCCGSAVWWEAGATSWGDPKMAWGRCHSADYESMLARDDLEVLRIQVAELLTSLYRSDVLQWRSSDPKLADAGGMMKKLLNEVGLCVCTVVLAVILSVPTQAADPVVKVPRILVLGHAQKPGYYPWVEGMTLWNAVTLAGGLKSEPEVSRVLVLRGNRRSFDAPATDLLQSIEKQNTPLQAGDIVYIGVTRPVVPAPAPAPEEVPIAPRLKILPGWKPFDFNGLTVYLVPLLHHTPRQP